MIFQKRLFRESRFRYFTVFSMEEKMPYQKPVFYAQTAPQGSYAATCSPKDRGPAGSARVNPERACNSTLQKCLNCERTK